MLSKADIVSDLRRESAKIVFKALRFKPTIRNNKSFAILALKRMHVSLDIIRQRLCEDYLGPKIIALRGPALTKDHRREG